MWYQFDRRGPRSRAQCRVDYVWGVAAVLGAVCSVDLVLDVTVSVGDIHEGDVFLDTAGPDPAFVAHLGASVPRGGAPVYGPDVEVIAYADDPDRHRVSQRAITSAWRNLQFFGCPDPGKFVVRPGGHWRVSFALCVLCDWLHVQTVPIRTSDLIARRSSIAA
jgi:hypothetical protein